MNPETEVDDNTTGFNLETQKLHCLVVLDDTVAKALSDKAGNVALSLRIVRPAK